MHFMLKIFGLAMEQIGEWGAIKNRDSFVLAGPEEEELCCCLKMERIKARFRPPEQGVVWKHHRYTKHSTLNSLHD